MVNSKEQQSNCFVSEVGILLKESRLAQIKSEDSNSFEKNFIPKSKSEFRFERVKINSHGIQERLIEETKDSPPALKAGIC